ncbi:ABC transporter permease subunit [Rhodococcus marinonascens]|uniref:ABC transporter permease subunit n=1 Tax=Rhodococcus marinonascens TaxID=38311 RepID=UPI0009332EA6|nr:ABC transporter permease subunit [Rhodococcus marinonascens]
MTTKSTTSIPHRVEARPPTRRLAAAWALVGKAIADRMTLSVVIGTLMIAMSAMVGALWPPLKDTFAEIPTALTDMVSKAFSGADLTTPAGWMNAELLSMVAPAGAIAIGVISAVRATAGEEEDKTLGALLGAPVGRTPFLLAKIDAMIVHVLVVCLFLAGGLIVGSVIGDLGLSATGIFGAAAHTALLGIVFGMIAIALGAGTGSRRLAAAATGGLAALAFAVSVFLPLSDTLAGGAKISPWYYYTASNPLVNGPDWAHLLILGTSALMIGVVAALIFERRDLRG